MVVISEDWFKESLLEWFVTAYFYELMRPLSRNICKKNGLAPEGGQFFK